MLISAHRAELPRHGAARTALEKLAEGPQPWGLPVFCIAEFVRVVTHLRVFDPPTPLDQALRFVAALLAAPTLRILSPGQRFPELFELCARHGDARGNLAFDAQIAAVCLEHGARDLWTFDRDFRRFPDLRPNAELT